MAVSASLFTSFVAGMISTVSRSFFAAFIFEISPKLSNVVGVLQGNCVSLAVFFGEN